MTVTERLFALRDEEYALFQAKLIPNVPPESIIGVRLPDVRKLAKELLKEGGYEAFLKELPHRYFDENMLHGILISFIKDFASCMEETERFLPYIDNWAVCDSMSPKIFAKHREKLLTKIGEWTGSEHTYTCRFGLGMLMAHFLDEDFRPEYLKIPAGIKSDEYYVNMMIAWYYATALAKQWNSTVTYIENGTLSVWVHNKTIQKARESFRITPEQKEYLRGLKM